MIITLTDDDLRVCREFVDNVIDTNIAQYKRRNQHNVETIKTQIINGKLAEIAVFRALKTDHPPDFEIYKRNRKSFNCDLKKGNKLIHVKSQTKESASKYGTSWTFQYNGNGRGHSDPLITSASANDVIVFTLIDELKVEIKAILFATDIKDLLRPPRLLHLQNSKRMVYLNDIKPEYLTNIGVL